MIPFVDLRAEYKSIKSEIDQAIRAVFEKGQFVLGENVSAFEQEFAEFCEVPFAVAVASGTSALHLALVACDVSPGDEVITVANTAAPTALAIAMTGARPVFVDIDPATYTMNPAEVQKATTSRTKAIIPVHLYGCSVDLDPILKIAQQANIFVIEDACQAHGATYRGKKLGTLGAAGCFSFYPTKNLGAYGDAGMVVTQDRALYEKLKMLSNLGQSDRYHHKLLGFNARLDELQAAILRVKLKHLDQWNSVRNSLANQYGEILNELPVALPVNPNYGSRVFHLYVVQFEKRDQLRKYLQAAGISTEIHFPIPLHLQEAFLYLGVAEGSLPHTEKAAKNILSLPLYPQLRLVDVHHIGSLIREFITKELSVL